MRDVCPPRPLPTGLRDSVCSDNAYDRSARAEQNDRTISQYSNGPATRCHRGAQLHTRVLCRRHRLFRRFTGLDRVQDRDDAEQHDPSEPQPKTVYDLTHYFVRSAGCPVDFITIVFRSIFFVDSSFNVKRTKKRITFMLFKFFDSRNFCCSKSNTIFVFTIFLKNVLL